MTINSSTDSVTAVFFSLLGGKFRLRLTDDKGPGRREGTILDDDGQEIGWASDFIYGGKGFAVHTKPFAGYVPMEQIEFV